MQRAIYVVLIISFFACQEDKQPTNKALDAIPIDAAIIIESNDVSKSLKEGDIVLTKSGSVYKLGSMLEDEDEDEVKGGRVGKTKKKFKKQRRSRRRQNHTVQK